MAKRKKRGLIVHAAGIESQSLGREFLKSPEKFMERLGKSMKDLECPPEVHKAKARGDAFAADVERIAVAPPKATVSRAEKLAIKHFGRDFEVSLVPFGLRFREKIDLKAGLEVTATASGTVTFLDSDADVDG